MENFLDIETIVFNNKKKISDKEYLDLMNRLVSLYNIMKTRVCSKDCKTEEDEEIECPHCGGCWYKSEYEY